MKVSRMSNGELERKLTRLLATDRGWRLFEEIEEIENELARRETEPKAAPTEEELAEMGAAAEAREIAAEIEEWNREELAEAA